MHNPLKIHHHPETKRLDAFAKGLCDKTESILLQVHLHYCSECQAYVERQKAPLGAEYEASDDSPRMLKRDLLFEKILSKLDKKESYGESEKYALPRVVASELPKPSSWKWLSFWPSKGKVAKLASDINGPYELFIGRLEEHYHSPSHTHLYEEQTVPLSGVYVSGKERFLCGDWSEAQKGEGHSPSSIEGGDCICLIRVHKSGYRFTGLSFWRNGLLYPSRFVGWLMQYVNRKYMGVIG